MATITGYTKDKMDEINDSTIVDGSVVGDNLILERRDGGTIDAGNVRGATGATGATGAAGAAGPARLVHPVNEISSVSSVFSVDEFLDIAQNNVPVVAGRTYQIFAEFEAAFGSFGGDPIPEWRFSFYINGIFHKRFATWRDNRAGQYNQKFIGSAFWYPSSTQATDDIGVWADRVVSGADFQLTSTPRFLYVVEWGVVT